MKDQFTESPWAASPPHTYRPPTQTGTARPGCFDMLYFIRKVAEGPQGWLGVELGQ